MAAKNVTFLPEIMAPSFILYSLEQKGDKVTNGKVYEHFLFIIVKQSFKHHFCFLLNTSLG